MTDLSNIFVGKRVVQKAYLNNALIYQSKGWEPTDNACTEAWDKQISIPKSAATNGAINSCVTDKDNNIYFCACGIVFKVDSSTGKLIKYSTTDFYIDYFVLDEPHKVIYCIGPKDNSGNKLFILDTNCTFLSYAKDLCMLTNGLYINSINVDSRYIYLTYNAGNSYFGLYVLDKNNYDLISSAGNYNNMPVITTYDGDYFYSSSYGYIIRYDKKTFTRSNISTSIPTFNKDVNTDTIIAGIIDEAGNILFYSYDRGVIKITNKGEYIATYNTYGYGSDSRFATDYKGNTYFLGKSSNTGDFDVYLNKITSDNTVQYKNNTLKGISSQELRYGGQLSNLCVDNVGNIYIIYMYMNGVINIKKIFNIAKPNK